jgi:ubiquinone/menaquinone biosynthesis C-methylase UbiE
MASEEIFGEFSTVVYSVVERLFLRWIHSEAIGVLGESACDGHVRMLELGYGTGRVAELFLRKQPGAEIMGVDISWPMATRASRRARFFFNLHPIQGISRLLPFRDEYFDIAYTVISMHHWGDKENSLAELRRVLRRGGLAVVVEYDRERAILGFGRSHAMTSHELQALLKPWFEEISVMRRRRLLVGIGKKS